MLGITACTMRGARGGPSLPRPSGDHRQEEGQLNPLLAEALSAVLLIVALGCAVIRPRGWAPRWNGPNGRCSPWSSSRRRWPGSC